VNSLPKTVTRQRHGCDLNSGLSALESSTLTTGLPSHPSLMVRGYLTGIDDNVREPCAEQKCFSDADGRSTETEQRSHCPADCSKWRVRRLTDVIVSRGKRENLGDEECL